MQENSEVIRSMISHMQSLFTEASFCSWDPAKFAHGCVLTDLEDGFYSCSDGERLAEVRRCGVQLRQTELVQEQPAHRPESSPPSHRVTLSNKQSKGASNTNRSDKKTERVCNYFNNQKCRFDSNHERDDVCWLHVCAKCKKARHIDSECNLKKMNAILDFLINFSDSNDNFENNLNTNDSIPSANDNICNFNSFENVFPHKCLY
jgi:hypothetical protein